MRTKRTPGARLIRALCIAASIIGAPPTAAADDEPPIADLVLRNGTVVTVDPALGTVQAVALRGDRILAVGSNEDVATHVGRRTRVIDLRGRFAMPGFVEGHGHFTGLGEAMMNLDLSRARTWAEVIRIVSGAASRTPAGEWIVGRGWHQEKWDRPPPDAVEGFPVHDDLSAACPDNPVLLTHASGHACFANELAMQLAGVSGATPDPPGGEILRDESGRAIGIFRESAESLVSRAMSAGEDARSVELRRRRAIELATRECIEKGVTSFQDAGSSFDDVDTMEDLAKHGQLGVRLWVMIRQPNDRLEARIADYAKIRDVGGGFLTVGGIKRTIDGALGSRGAWLLEPYSDSPESTGLATATVEDVTRTAWIAREHGLQFCVHAIGDRANREVLDIFETVMPEGEDRRWRIEHAQHVHPDDIPRFGRLGVIASMQGVHCTSDGPWVVARLGHERARTGAYMWKRFLETGAVVSNGTDAPVEDVDPVASYYATVTRRMADGNVFFGDQRLTRMEALRSYTIDAAYAAFEEDLKGSLTPGKYADVVVLSRNILEAPEEQIRDAEVEMTIIGGKIVHDGR
jgi:predicted amidohydrolase YtcJ